MNNNDNLPTRDEKSLSGQFGDEIFNPTFDLATDYSEIYIDDLIENETLKEIPLVKSIVGVIRAGISINQFWFAKKLLTFIQEFNLGQIDEEKKSKFKKRFNEDTKYRKKTTEQIMIFVDRFTEINKAKISALLLKAYIEERLTYKEFVSINICLENLHPESYNFFKTMETLRYEIEVEYKGERNADAESLLLTSGLAAETSQYWHGFRIKDEGIKLYELAIRPLIQREQEKK
jgi:hypothetical protein